MSKPNRVNLDYSSTSKKTIPQLFLEKVQASRGNIAFYYKNLGIYKEVSWQEYKEHVENTCLGLLELGLRRGDRVAIMGDPCAECYYTDLGIISAGAISVGIYTTCSVKEVEYLLGNSGVRFVLAENQEYVDDILSFIDRQPNVQRIIVADTRAMFTYTHPKLMSFIEIEELGRQRKARESDLFEKVVADGRHDDVAVIVYTSGTDEKPKGAMLSHQNLLSRHYSFLELFPKFLTHQHRVVTHLGLAHALEREMSLISPLLGNVIPHIGEKAESLQETVHEVQPNVFHGVPRIWEKMAAQIVGNIRMSSWLKRKSYEWAMRIGRRYRQMCWGERHSLVGRLICWMASVIVFRRILTKAGLSKTKYAFSTTAALPPEVQSLWQTWGVDLISLYASVEAGFITAQRPGFPKPEDVGKPSSMNKVRLGDDGEVLVYGPGVMLGYWQDDEATGSTIENGWCHVGDYARFEGDKLKLIDRKKNMMKTANGVNVAPTGIELALKGSPYISEAILFAEKRKFASALIEINYDTTSEWARSNKVYHTGFAGLATDPQVHQLIAREVESANCRLAGVAQVKKFRIIPKELNPGGEYLTPTRKIRRKHIYELFKDLVEEMYEEEEGIDSRPE